jgi:hypothetical protein
MEKQTMTNTMPPMDLEALAAALDPERVMARATQETGLEDYAPVVEALTVLVDSVRSEGRFNAVGYFAMAEDLNRWLTNWLKFRSDLERHPEILDEDVSDPIVILGLPRTGTTKLQRVMSQHQSVHQLSMWKCFYPAPVGEPDEHPDPRIALTAQLSDAMIAAFPDFPTMHPMASEEPEEDVFLMRNTLQCAVNGMLLRAPSYLDWLLNDHGVEESYDYLRQLLQYLQWQEGGRRGPWVLKTPLHLGRIDTLLSRFPAATLVHCHRDVSVCMASLCRIMEAARTIGSDNVDLGELGGFIVDFWSREWELNLSQRSSVPSTQIVDVQYEAIRTDSAAICREVFAQRGMALSEHDVEAMTSWQSENPQHRLGKIEYSLDRYDLTPAEVQKAFSTYLDLQFSS